ncbi:MAG: DUF1302 domain-containing protein [Gammaproteobacteria bacterium]|nr:DUF1302 domain-containing protein [Gammaproteobacteria bacterium]
MNNKLIVITTASTLLLTCGLSNAASFNHNGLQGQIDTTLSYGLASRVESRDQRIIGIANGGTAFGANSDDGNLNYDKGIISNAFKVTSEMELSYQNYGAFVRASAFYDIENEKGDRARTPLSEKTLDLSGSAVKLLDAYLWSQFNISNQHAEVRIGNQLLSWGESTFIQNSINTINPVDVSKIRVPGAELREALIPVPILSAAMDTSDNTSIELFYQLKWEKTIADPVGSYFSANDFAADGGSRVMLGWGAVPDQISPGTVVSPPATTAVVSRAPDQEAKDSGQFGLAFRLYSEALNNTEFGFYYINYHSRLPLIGAITGTAAATLGVDPNGQSYVESARYFISYPEDIKLYGLSFNTLLGRSGIALQGEVSYRQDVPLQIDDIEILLAALGAQANLSPAAALLANEGQLGLVGFETVIPGYLRRDVSQTQVTATKIFGPAWGANATVLLGEVGVTTVLDMPDKEVLRLNGPGTFVSGNPNLAPLHQNSYETADRFADQVSWGYRLLARMQFDNVYKSINLAPRIAWQHDVNGISPGPAGNFIEGRRAVTLGLSGDYQNVYSADISYTRFSGAGRYNLINDRDFIAANIKYSF